MKLVYLHIGSHKTGSTSIQRFLARADDALSKQGVLYPEAGRPDTGWSNQYGQHKLGWSVRGIRGITDERVWDGLREEMNEYHDQAVVISAEGLGCCTSGEVQKVVSHLAPYPIRVILYLRPPVDFLRSAYKQRVKMGTYSGSFRQFTEDMMHRCDYLNLVSRWEEFDAVESVDIRLFDKVKSDPGLEASFADAVGIDFEEVEAFVGPPVNTSPQDDSVQVARWINALAVLRDGSETWQTLASRARSNLLGHRWPGTWLRSVVQPFVRGSLVTDRAVDELREELGESHERFLRKYVSSEDWTYLPL